MRLKNITKLPKSSALNPEYALILPKSVLKILKMKLNST